MAGAVQLARIDRQIGAKGKLTRTWLVASRSSKELGPEKWLESERGRWGIETRNHYPLDVTHREDESAVRHHNAATVLGIFRRLSNALKQIWVEKRPKREATSRDWVEENQFNRWLGIHLFTSTVSKAKRSCHVKCDANPSPHGPNRV